MLEQPLSVLVVDDTVTYRRLISRAVDAQECAATLATAPTGEIALKKMAQTPPDLVLLDVEMPGMGGIETLKCIKRDFPATEVVMVSGITERAASITIEAMKDGAFEFVSKPVGSQASDNAKLLEAKLGRVIEAVWRRRQMQSGAAVSPAPAPPPAARVAGPRPRSFALLAIGVSTGGPKALARLLPELPGDFPLPVVVVQHMPAAFTRALAEDLNRHAALEVREAAEGDLLSPGRVLLAPGGRHLVLRGGGDAVAAGLNDGPRENSCRPAVDVLFRSAAACYGERGVLAVVLTGMGSDGMKGVQALKRKGCHCLTQSEASCVVYGMPQAVVAAGLSDETLALEQMPARLVALAGKGAAAS